MYKEKHSPNEMPTLKFLLPYVLLALHKLGGEAKGKEVIEELINRFDLSDEILEKKYKRGAPVFDARVAFARLHIKMSNYLDSPKVGIWRLTQKGKDKVKELEEGGQNAFNKFREDVNKKAAEETKKLRSMKRTADSTGSDEENLELEESPEENRLQKDLEKIKKLDPYAFERLCARLFKAIGYEDVKATMKGHDGGIDGIGYLVLGLIRFKVVFQAKRFADVKVNTKDIDALAGSMRKTRAEKAIFITTSYFTRDARETALDYGIELVNGEKLMELLYKYEIGYSKNFDEEFFANI